MKRKRTYLVISIIFAWILTQSIGPWQTRKVILNSVCENGGNFLARFEPHPPGATRESMGGDFIYVGGFAIAPFLVKMKVSTNLATSSQEDSAYYFWFFGFTKLIHSSQNWRSHSYN